MVPLHQTLRVFVVLALASSAPAFQRPPVRRAAPDSRGSQEAFIERMRALQSQPPSAPSSDINRLRREIIDLVRGMEAPPPIPAEARRRLDNAIAFDEARGLLGPTAPGAAAVETELQAALAFAPWWPEALLKLAQTQTSFGRLKEAEEAMSLYQLAMTPAPARNGPQPGTRPAAAAAPGVSAASGTGTGTGTMMVYWPRQFASRGRPKVKCDGAHMADIGNQRYIRIEASAGLHEVAVHNVTTGARVLPGTISYLRAAVGGKLMPRLEIREVHAAEAQAEMLEKAADLNEPEKTYSDVCGRGKK